MDPITAAAAISAGTALVGGILGNQQSASNTAAANAQTAANQASANLSNERSAIRRMNFQERMSNTAYQRAMDDMRKANLNPMLAYMQGGASSPSGAGSTAGAAHAQAAPYTDPLGPAVSSAVDTYFRGQGVAQGARGLGIQEGQLEVAKANSKADIAKKASDIAMQSATAKRIEMETRALQYRIHKEKLDSDFYGSDAGKTMYYLDKINGAAGGSLDILNKGLDLINPLRSKIPNGPRKLQEKFNPKTGEIEKWLP